MNTQRAGIIKSDQPCVRNSSNAITGEGYRNLQEGASVEFEVVKGPKGFQAANVVPL